MYRHTRFRTLASSLALLAFVGFVLTGCQHATSDDADDTGGQRDSLAQQEDDSGSSGGKADGSSYDPCGAKTCGETCTLCAPNDSDCNETAVVKYCQSDGTCAATQPQCGGGGSGGSGGSGSYDPCGSKTCGETCTVCAPNDSDCNETAVVKYCQSDGTCAATQPQCGGSGSGSGSGGSTGGCQTDGDCSKGQFCHKSGADACAATATGTCKAKPSACTQQYDPVCGCDAKTYSNSCMAEAAGVNIAHDGEC